MAKVRERALDHKCPNCGSKILFVPALGKWKCDNCNGEFDLEELKKHNNASSEENNDKKSEVDDTNYVEYHCKDCGAGIIADENTASTFCVYCGNTAILKSKLSGKFAPSKIIPFKKSKEEAIEAFKNISKGRPLMPRLFNKNENIEKISGVYIPFWLFSVKSKGDIKVNAKKIKTWVSGNYTYTQTDTYEVDRSANMYYDMIPFDGSTRFDDDLMNTIEPFDYKEMVEYNHAYLSGFLAEKYDVESTQGEQIIKDRSEETTKNKLLNSITGYTTKTITNSNFETNIDKVEYVLLPVWIVNVKYKDKYYTFAMNAQTGEFVGDIPTSKARAIIFGSIIFIAIFLLIALISFLFLKFKGGM